MRCEDAWVLISREIDGELSAQQKADLRRHVAHCAECAGSAERLSKVQRLIGESLPATPPDGYWEGLSARIAGAAEQPVGRAVGRVGFYRTVCWLAAAACVALCVGVLAQTWRIESLRARTAAQRAAVDRAGTAPYDLATLLPRAERAMHRGATEQSQAFDMLGDYFQGGLEWMVQDGAQAELGVSAGTPADVAGREDAAAVEIWVLRVLKNREPQLLSAPRLMILPGAEANFRLADTSGVGERRFRYRCGYMRTDGGAELIGVTLEVTPTAGGSVVRLSGTVGLGDVRPVPAAYSRVGDAGYVLLMSTRRVRENLPGITST